MNLATELIKAAEASKNVWLPDPNKSLLKDQPEDKLKKVFNAIEGRMTIEQIAEKIGYKYTATLGFLAQLVNEGKLSRGRIKEGTAALYYWRKE